MKLKELQLPKIENAAGDMSRPTLASVYYTGREFQACDGFILARVTPHDPLDMPECIIHLTAWELAQEDKAELEYMGKNAVKVSCGGLAVTYDGGDYYGRYPDVEQIKPSGTVKPLVEIDARELVKLGKSVYLATGGASRIGPDRDNMEPVEFKSAKWLPGHEIASVTLDTGRLLQLAKALMHPVMDGRRQTFPVRLSVNGRDDSPVVVEPVETGGPFESHGLIMPIWNGR